MMRCDRFSRWIIAITCKCQAQQGKIQNQKQEADQVRSASVFSTPKGSRIPVASVKGRCPRPLDDGGLNLAVALLTTFLILSIIFINVNTF